MGNEEEPKTESPSFFVCGMQFLSDFTECKGSLACWARARYDYLDCVRGFLKK